MPGPYLIDVNDVDDLEAALAEAVSRPEALLEEARSLCSDLHSFTDGCSSARVINAVEDFLDTGTARLKPKPLNLLRKLKVRKRLAKELQKNA